MNYLWGNLAMHSVKAVHEVSLSEWKKKKNSLQLERLSHRLWKEHWKSCHTDTGNSFEIEKLSFWLWKEQWRLPWNEKVVILAMERTVETSLKWKCCHSGYWKNSGDFLEMKRLSFWLWKEQWRLPWNEKVVILAMERTVETSLKWKGCHSDCRKNSGNFLEMEKLSCWLWKEQWRLRWNGNFVEMERISFCIKEH